MEHTKGTQIEGKKGGFSKGLAIAGTALAWLPIVAPVVVTVVFLITNGLFRFDFLMPAELFPLALLGGGLLVWAALRARSQRGWILGGLGAAIALLLISQLVAEVTGLANGDAELVGFWFVLVVVMIVAYTLAVIAMAVGGSLLIRNLFISSNHA